MLGLLLLLLGVVLIIWGVFSLLGHALLFGIILIVIGLFLAAWGSGQTGGIRRW